MTTAYENFRNANGLGQRVKDESIPVVLASDSSAAPFTSTQLPAALGQQTAAGSVSTVQARTAEDNLTYWSNLTMATDQIGVAITVGAQGRLMALISWTNSTAQVGVLSLQGLAPDGTTWTDIQGASAEFTTQPSSNTATLQCSWRELQLWTSVRLKYTRTSGGAAANNLSAQIRTV